MIFFLWQDCPLRFVLDLSFFIFNEQENFFDKMLPIQINNILFFFAPVLSEATKNSLFNTICLKLTYEIQSFGNF